MNRKVTEILLLTLFLVTIVASIRPYLPKNLEGTPLGNILITEGFTNWIFALSLSVFTGLLIYYLTVLEPERRLSARRRVVLDACVLEVTAQFKKSGVFDHQAATRIRSFADFPDTWFDKATSLLNTPFTQVGEPFLHIQGMAEVASSKLGNFQQSAILALQISPELYLAWLEVINRLTQLKNKHDEIYKPQGTPPPINIDSIIVSLEDANSLRCYAKDYLEVTKKWKNNTL